MRPREPRDATARASRCDRTSLAMGRTSRPSDDAAPEDGRTPGRLRLRRRPELIGTLLLPSSQRATGPINKHVEMP